VDQGGGVEQFHGGAQGDEPRFFGAQHVPDQQAEGGADALPARRKQMFERGAQVWVGIVGLNAHALFYDFDLFLDR